MAAAAAMAVMARDPTRLEVKRSWFWGEGAGEGGQLTVALKAIRPQHRKTRLRL